MMVEYGFLDLEGGNSARLGKKLKTKYSKAKKVKWSQATDKEGLEEKHKPKETVITVKEEN